MARPTDDPKTFRLDLRFPPDLVEKVDEWRRVEKDIPPRAEAMRRLVDRGLSYDELENVASRLVNWIAANCPEEVRSSEKREEVVAMVNDLFAIRRRRIDQLQQQAIATIEGMLPDIKNPLLRELVEIDLEERRNTLAETPEAKPAKK